MRHNILSAGGYLHQFSGDSVLKSHATLSCLVIFLALSFGDTVQAERSKPRRPNIVLIMADDM